MKRMQATGINLYESYLAQTKKEQSDKTGKRVALLLPLAALLLALLAVSGRQLIINREKSEAVDALTAEIDALTPAYENVQALQTLRGETEATHEALAGARFLFTLYPAPTRDLFVQVRKCAEGIFNISDYRFEEATSVLTIDASAASVNEVPLFVQRLRDTELFSLVQYVGYTSKDTQEYFCTVDCMLHNEEAIVLEALLNAESAGGETDGADGADAAGTDTAAS